MDTAKGICPKCARDKREKYGKPVQCKCGYDWRYEPKPDKPQTGGD